MELKMKQFVIAFLCFLPVAALAQQTIAPFKTQQANTVFYVNMGTGSLYTTIQKTVTAACAYATATIVDILPGANPSDTIGGLTSACTTTIVFDQRTAPATNYTCSVGGCTVAPYSGGATGTAGGDLSGTYPNPTVAKVNGAAVPLSAKALASNGTGQLQTATDVPLLDTANTFSRNQTVAAATPATSSANQSSPVYSWTSNFWTGSASAMSTWSWQDVLGTGASPTSTWTLSHTAPGGVGGIGVSSVSIPYVVNVSVLVSAGLVEGLNVTGLNLVQGIQGVLAGGTLVGAPGSSNGGPVSSAGSFWNGTVGVADTYSWQNIVGSGTNPTTTYNLTHTGATTQPNAVLHTTANNFLLTADIVNAIGPISTQGPLGGGSFVSTTNCNSTANPAACGAAPAGFFTVPVGTSSITVNSTAVTLTSTIVPIEDMSIGTTLGVTCNNTQVFTYLVQARSVGSFTLGLSPGVATNPACFSYFIIN